MIQKNWAWYEYRQVMNKLEVPKLCEEPVIQELRQILRSGWLTPGSEILFRLENEELSVGEVLLRPPSLQRKWFLDLTDPEKARWLKLFGLSPETNCRKSWDCRSEGCSS